MKKIIIESCTKCPYSDFSIHNEDEMGNFILNITKKRNKKV